MTIIYDELKSIYNIFDDSEKIATFTESELHLIASENNIVWPVIINPDCCELNNIVEIALLKRI